MPNSTAQGLEELEELKASQEKVRELYFACKESKNTNSKECQDYVEQIVKDDYTIDFVLGMIRS